MATHEIHLDCAAFEAAIRDVATELERLSALPLSPQATERILEVAQGLDLTTRGGAGLLAEGEGGAARAAGPATFTINPSERLLAFRAALRAFTGRGDFVFESHGADGTGGSAPPAEGQAFR